MSTAWHFSDRAAANQLRAAAAAWEKTPFAPRQCVRGVGVDCLRLVHALLCLECGLEFAFPAVRYEMQESLNRRPGAPDRLLDALRAEPRLAEIAPPAPPMIGDIVGFNWGHGLGHIGVVLDPPRWIHVLGPPGAAYVRLDDPTFSRRIHGYFRARAGAS